MMFFAASTRNAPFAWSPELLYLVEILKLIVATLIGQSDDHFRANVNATVGMGF